jgi:hypothetical protein
MNGNRAAYILGLIASILATFLIASWAGETKYVLRSEYNTIIKQIDKLDRKMDRLGELLYEHSQRD